MDEKLEAAHESTLKRWERKRGSLDSYRDLADAATDATRKMFKKMLKNERLHRQLATEAIAGIKGEASPPQFRGNEQGFRLEGFNDPGVNEEGIPTGLDTPSYLRDDDD